MPDHDPRDPHGLPDWRALRRVAAEEAGISPEPPLGVGWPAGERVIGESMSDLELANALVRVTGHNRLYTVLMRLAGRLVCDADSGNDVLVITKGGAVVRGKCTEAGQDWVSVDVHGDN